MQMINFLRTEESRFENLADYPFEANFIEIAGIRMHYIDEGPKNAHPVLLLHGNPTWSYMYRNVIAALKGEGYRVISPDMIGFGKSDKPRHFQQHTLKFHIEFFRNFIEKLNISNISLFGQDWGSIIGLRLLSEYPDLFSAAIISNGMLPIGRLQIPIILRLWRFFSRISPIIPVDLIVGIGARHKLKKEIKRAYRSPFPTDKYKVGIRALPNLIPLKSDDKDANENQKAWEKLKNWKKPFLTIFSRFDPFTKGFEKHLIHHIPGAKDQNHVILNGGHFLPEDCNSELSQEIILFINKIRSMNNNI